MNTVQEKLPPKGAPDMLPPPHCGEQLDVVFYRDTAHSFIKAYLLKLTTGATMLPENQSEAIGAIYLSHTYTHRFSLEQLLIELQPVYRDLFATQQKEFQTLVKELNWLLYHRSPNKYFIARKILDKVFTDCDFVPVLKQECFEGVQLQRYVQDVKREYYALLHAVPAYQWGDKCVYEINPTHPIGTLLARVVANHQAHLKIILKCNQQTLLMHAEHQLSLAHLVPIHSEADFDKLWQNHFKFQPVLALAGEQSFQHVA